MNRYIVLIFLVILFAGCEELDLTPRDMGSTENWYSNDLQMEQSLNDFYRKFPYYMEVSFRADMRSDNWIHRETLEDYVVGSIDADWAISKSTWKNAYKSIGRANRIIANVNRKAENFSESRRDQFEAEAKMFRAFQYGRLVFLYGDVPLNVSEQLSLDEAFEMGRTDKEEVKKQIWKDFDDAIGGLPEPGNEGSDVDRANRGTALGLKNRIALWLGDYDRVIQTAEELMEKEYYELYPDYGELFQKEGERSNNEVIFRVARSKELDKDRSMKSYMTRNAGGTNTYSPSWSLFASYLCTDGLPIDESPLFDSHEPFKNRDPRLAETIVPFGEEHLGYIFSPHPDDEKVEKVSSGKMVSNSDTRSVNQYASYNAMTLKKYANQEWVEDLRGDDDHIIMRYAEVLLNYVEAKVEKNDLDQSVLDAINQVRKRAYNQSDVDYPEVTARDRDELRSIYRFERRMEFAFESQRMFDLLRWKIAEDALSNRPVYGMLNPNELKETIVDKGEWFWPEAPEINDNGLSDFSKMEDKGYIRRLVERNFDERQYLFPIPTEEVQINENMEQNPGY